MEEIQKIYNQLVEGIETPEDTILKMNDVFGVLLLMIVKTLQMQKDNSKRSLVIDSIKAMTNNFIASAMKVVSEEEVKTIEND